MVLVEFLEAVIAMLFEEFGVAGVSVGAVALLLAGIWYGHEISDVLVGTARWVRIASIVVGVVSVTVVAGVATGALSLDSGVVAQLFDLLSGFTEGH